MGTATDKNKAATMSRPQPLALESCERALAAADTDALRDALRIFFRGNERAQRALAVVLHSLASGERVPPGVSLISFGELTPAARAAGQALARELRAESADAAA